MPVYQIKGTGGKIYPMSWEGLNPPTSADIDEFLDKQEHPQDNSTLGKIKQLVSDSFNTAKPYLNKLLDVTSGLEPKGHPELFYNEDEANNINSKYGKKIVEAGERKVMGGVSDESLLPDIKHEPDTFLGGAARQLYRDFVRPMVSPLGILGSASIEPVPRINPEAFAKQLADTKAAYETAGIVNAPKKPLALPPAPPETSFVAGDAGVAKAGQTYPVDFGPVNPTIGADQGTVLPQEYGSITQLPPDTAARLGTTVGRIPEMDTTSVQGTLQSLENAKNGPMTLPKVKEEPKPFEPRGSIVNEPPADNQKARKFGETVEEYKKRIAEKIEEKGQINAENIKDIQEKAHQADDINTKPLAPINELPEGSSVATPTRQFGPTPDFQELGSVASSDNPSFLDRVKSNAGFIRLRSSKPGEQQIADLEAQLKQADNARKVDRLQTPTITATPVKPNGQAVVNGAANLKTTNVAGNYRPIPIDTDPKSAILQYATGLNGAKFRGQLIKDKFAALSDPELVGKYEAGFRDKNLKVLEDYFDQRLKEAQKLGILKEDQQRLNYLRHYFEQDPEEQATKLKSYIAKNPQFAKTGHFQTYEQAAQAGLTPKYKTIPEIAGAYESEFQKAVRTKELYEYLRESKQLKPGTTLSTPMSEWNLIGPNKDQIKELLNNVTSQSYSKLHTAADMASMTKNLYLAGGVPYTKYNMHAWNIARNDMTLNGYVSGLKKLLSDPTGSRAEQWYKNLSESEKGTLADLVDRGWQFKPMSDIGKEANVFSKAAEKLSMGKTKSILGGIGTGAEKIQDATEAPLFEKALPALNAQRTLEAFHNLESRGMPREQALKAAAKIGNDFYGGVNTVLRNPNAKDIGRITFLAPNWMESQLTKAVKEWKSAGKVLAGKGDPVDKMYAKALGRSVGLTATGAVAASVAGNKIRSGRDIAAIPFGKENNKTQREIPLLGTANEEVRLPIQTPYDMIYKRNPAALKDILIKNRISLPLKTVINLVKGEDDFGNALSGKDKFGRPITFGKSIMNYTSEASRPFQHQAIQALVGYLNGKITAEEAAAQGLELPIAYSKEPKSSHKPSASAPRIRLRH